MNNRLIPPPDSPGINNLTTQHEQQEGFVDPNALAEHLSVTRRQVLEMTRRGIIPAHPLGIGTRRTAAITIHKNRRTFNPLRALECPFYCGSSTLVCPDRARTVPIAGLREGA